MSETVFASSALILAVLLLRVLLGGKVSTRLIYALWLPVAIRLLIPWGLPVSPVSVVPLEVLRNTETALSEPVGAPQPSAVRVFVPVDSSGDGTTDVPSVRYARATVPTPPPRTRGEFLNTVWQLGMLAVGIAVIFSNLCFYVRLRQTRKRLELAAPCPVWLAEGLPSPCLYGNAVYLNIPLEGEQLRHVLAHELTHRRHGDALWALLTSVCLTVYWFNPLVWLAASLSRRDCELACDEGALARLDPQERISYGRTLLALVEHRRRPSDFLCHATMMSKSAMGARIRRIAKQPRTYAAAVLLIAVGLVLACVASYTSPDRYVSREVLASITKGCRSDNPAERAAWEQLRDEFLPAYRETASDENGPILLESLALKRSHGMYPILGDLYNDLFWDIRLERTLSEPVNARINERLPKPLRLYGQSRPTEEGWTNEVSTGITEKISADETHTLSSDEEYCDAIEKEQSEIRWPDIELHIPGDDFAQVAEAFLNAIGERFRNASEANSGKISSYEIVEAEIYDTIPGDRDHFAFRGKLLMTPVHSGSIYPYYYAYPREDGKADWESQLELVRAENDNWHIENHGWNVLADQNGETGWYYKLTEAEPAPLSTTSNEWEDIAQKFLEQYGLQLRQLLEQKNRYGVQSVTFSNIQPHDLDETNLEQSRHLPEAHPNAFYVTACADVLTSTSVMPWEWYGIWRSGKRLEDGRLRFYIGLVLWQEQDGWHGNFIDPADVFPAMILYGEPVSPDGSWKLEVGWASADNSQLMLTLIDAKSGRVCWEDTDYYKQTALWSPDSRYVALNRTAYGFIETAIIDTEDFSVQSVPQPDLSDGVRLAAPAQQDIEALEWLDNLTLRCRSSYHDSSSEEPVTNEFTYIIQ